MAQLNRRAMPLQSKVAIVGGGLGGLTLGRVLHVNGIEATIYEQDSSATSRNQGGTLDIHAESGQAALQAAGLLQEFQAIARPEGEAMTITDSTGQTLWHDDGFDGTRPEVDRTKLRDMLLASLPDGMVQWNSKLTGVRSLGNGRHELTFGGGSTVTTDVLVGADGARSKVRALLSDATPIYSGVSFIELSLSNADTRHPSCAEMVGAGSFMALAHGKGLIAQRNADGNIRVYVALQAPPDWPDDFRRAAADAVAAKAQLLQHFDGWAGELRALIADADGALIPRPIYALPVGHCWPRVAGVTLLGDAAHLMSPFAGEGANLAMLDGAELGLAIAKHNSIETALAAYEAGMFARAGEAAAESADNLKMCFQQDAAQRLADLMASFHDECP